MVFVELLTLIIFIAILSKSSGIVVENASKLALFFGVSQLAVGMLLIAVATSLPELSVTVAAGAAKESSISAGNVFGSNIANILVILGAGAALYGFRVGRSALPDIALVLTLTTIISIYILYHSEIAGSALGIVEGVLLLLIFAWYANRLLHKGKLEGMPDAKEMTKHEGLLAFLFFCAGILGVIVSAHFVVDSAVTLAETFGLAKSFIGATLIAIGTSLPELSIDLAAIRKKQYGLAIGDAIGSNMANLTLVLGVAAVMNPIVVQLEVFAAALLFAVVANMVFFYIAVVKKQFARREGLMLLGLYALYLVVILYLQASEVVADSPLPF